MPFPSERLRRLRTTEPIRRMVRETSLNPADLIYPLFVRSGQGRQDPIASMPGQYRRSIDLLIKEAAEAQQLGIPAVILFGIPDSKDERGTSGLDPNGIVPQAVRALKDQVPGLLVITDVCIDEYTSHGHCGIVREGKILNDETLDCLQTMALAHAQAGADMVAPSDMMDGRVGAIREALDRAGFEDLPIMAYSAKYASGFYGPFRDAVGSAGYLGAGDKKTYQMDPANTDEAMREIALDLQEGADMVMVKPGLPYLDVIRRVKDTFKVPTFAYNVSGEYSMLKAAAQQGWLDYDRVMMESLLAFKRAGADGILTYAAVEAATLLTER